MIKIALKFNSRPLLRIEYKEGSWEKIEKKWQSLGLSLKKSSNLFGRGMEGFFYKLEGEEIFKFLGYWGDSNKNNINSPVFNHGHINVGFLRIVPQNDIIEIPLEKFITIKDLYELIEETQRFLNYLLNIVIEKEITLNFKNKST